MTDRQKLIDYALAVSSLSQAGTLSGEGALQFCQLILPHLLAELEVSRRVDERLASMFPEPAPQPQPEQPQKKHRQERKRPAKKATKRRVKDDSHAS